MPALILVLLVHVPIKLWWSKATIANYCDGVRIGEPTEVYERQANYLGFRVWQNSPEQLNRREAKGTAKDSNAARDDRGQVLSSEMLTMAGWAFARTFCTVYSLDGKVLAKKVSALD